MMWAVLLAALCLPHPLFGQGEMPAKLSEKLTEEGLAALATAARQQGNPIRGAILFSEKRLRCVECHARGSRDRLGPDLTQLDTEVTDQHVVESVLLPSARLREGFETESFLLEDGKLVTGRVLADQGEAIVLRSDAEPTRTLRVAKEEIVQRKRNPKSAMPDGLVDLLSSRQDFLDLVSYLYEIVATSESRDSLPSLAVADSQQLDPRILGLAFLDAYRCKRCHDAPAGPNAATASHQVPQAPRLEDATARIDRAYLERFIADPLHVKSGTHMPDVMGQMTKAERSRAAKAIVDYLQSRTNQTFRRQAIDPEAAQRGRELFHSVGCVACHAPRDADGNAIDVGDAVSLDGLPGKYSVDSLAAFLENPLSVRPSGRMPNLWLTHWEAVDLASYLLTSPATAPSPATATSPDTESVPGGEAAVELQPAQVEAGRKLFDQLGCVQCHRSDEIETASSIPLVDLDVQRGCLSDDAGAWPRYDLLPSTKEAIRLAIAAMDQPLSESQQIEWTLASLRCYECHRRDGVGGVSEQRDSFFLTSNENLGPQGRIPPSLTGVGGKLQPKWLRQVLVSGRRIRPYVTTRMPGFGAGNVEHLLALFPQVDPLPEVSMPKIEETKEMRNISTELVGSSGLNCIACHTFQNKGSQAMPAVDLTEMAERLHAEWFHAYMLSPQLINPNTVMPSFWPGGRAIRKDILDGKADQQIAALWQYLQEGRQAPVPRGLHLEPMELLAEADRAVMLRRSYPGIGKRGIGVGYPAGANLAYDAEQLRIGMIWKGRFADPGGVWRGQGHGNVRPLGTDVIQFATGPELDHAENPWVVDEGRPPQHQFTGYSLDSMGRPTFTYRFGEVQVEDSLVEARDPETDAVTLSRQLTFRSERQVDKLRFRLATGGRIAERGNRQYLVDDKLRVTIADDHQAEVVEQSSEQWLVVPLNIGQGTSSLAVQYTW